MQIHISRSKLELGERAAKAGAALIQLALKERGEAFIIMATGVSQFEMLQALVQEDIEWTKVIAFHLDEYIGLPITHPASFRRYLRERFVEKLPQPIRTFHYIDGEEQPKEEIARLSRLISTFTIDVAFVGIGENAHLAFNDPPADFQTEEPYLLVNLEEACRRQQLGEGWFANLEEAPRQAISMSIRQIMKSGAIICSVPDLRKANAVEKVLEGPITPQVPASLLQSHPHCQIFLDADSASLLKKVAR